MGRLDSMGGNVPLDIDEYLVSVVTGVENSVVYVALIEGVCVNSSVYNEESQLIGYISSLRSNDIEVFLTVDAKSVSYNAPVYLSKNPVSVSFSESMAGSVIDPFGNLILSLVERDDFKAEEKLPIFKAAPGISERGSLSEQVLTGFNAVDFMYPIGHGQRMLIVGDRKTLKTSIATGLIKNYSQNHKLLAEARREIFIYVSIGQRAVDLARVIGSLVDLSEENVIVISSCSSSPLGCQFLAPYSAMSIAERYAEKGMKCTVIIDDISKHALAHREMTLLAGRLPGREAYQGDIFYMHSSLLERSFKYRNGGSVTCVPIVETINEEISAYIPTNVISITDGQVFCSRALINEDIMPPISSLLSVSRTGSSVQTGFMRRVMGSCKKVLSHYNNLVDFYRMYREDCDLSVKKCIKDGLIYLVVLYRINDSPLNFIEQLVCVRLLDMSDRIFENLGISDIDTKGFTKKIKRVVKSSAEIIEDDVSISKKVLSMNIDEEVLARVSDIAVSEYENYSEENTGGDEED